MVRPHHYRALAGKFAHACSSLEVGIRGIQDGLLEDIKGDWVGLAEGCTGRIDEGRAHQMGAAFYLRKCEGGGLSPRHLSSIQGNHDLVALLKCR